MAEYGPAVVMMTYIIPYTYDKYIRERERETTCGHNMMSIRKIIDSMASMTTDVHHQG